MRELTERSQWILSLTDDWDGDGSMAYAKETVDAAVSFVRRMYATAVSLGLSFDTPYVNPGPDGSIDIHWNNDRYELLLNISPAMAIDLYGEDKRTGTIKGTAEVTGDYEWLIWWMNGRRKS